METSVMSLVIYIILVIAVIVVGFMFISKGKMLFFSEEKKLSKLFEHEIVHPMKGPTHESLEIVCKNNMAEKVTLKGMSFDYIGKEENIEFSILLDIGGEMVKGLYKDGSETNDKIKCWVDKETGNIVCDPPRDYYFYIPSSAEHLSSRNYYHFTVWRSQILKHLGSATFTYLLDNYYKYYLASFGIGGFLFDQKCLETVCAEKKKEECSGECFWKGDWFPGIGGKCSACPIVTDKIKCSEHDVESCQECPQAKASCEWFGGRCVPRGYEEAELRCRNCMNDLRCDAGECHAYSTITATHTFNCWFISADKECHLCPEYAACDMFDKNDCNEATRCMPDGVVCELVGERCVKKEGG